MTPNGNDNYSSEMSGTLPKIATFKINFSKMPIKLSLSMMIYKITLINNCDILILLALIRNVSLFLIGYKVTVIFY